MALLVTSSWGQSMGEIAKQLAPTGTLRVVINLGNPILARQDSASVSPVGVSVDLAQALASKFNLPITLMPVTSAGQSVALVTEGQADLGFFAIDPVRGNGITFTPAYVLIEGSYLVKNNSPLTDNAQVDQAQHRVVVGQGSAYDLFLSRHIQQAELVRAASTQEVMPVFWAEGYEVAAGLQHAMSEEVKQHPQLQILSPPFMAIAQAMGCHPSRSDEVKAGLQNFLEKQKPEIAASIARHGLGGMRTA